MSAEEMEVQTREDQRAAIMTLILDAGALIALERNDRGSAGADRAKPISLAR